MAIQLLSTILVREVEPLDDGYVRFLPISTVSIPTEERDAMQGAGFSKLKRNLPPMRALVWFWGGKAGESFSIGGQFHYAHGESSDVVTMATDIWLINPIQVADIEIRGDMVFAKSGVMHFELFLNNEPLIRLPIPVYWADELPEP